jgi:hypothetical protein
MHLGYHELRNMLGKFREEREKTKQAAPSSAPAAAASTASSGPPRERGGDYRPSRGGDDHRDRDRERDRGYDRHSSSRSYELVFLHCWLKARLTCVV